MSLLLGTIIPHPIQISHSYLIQILKQVKHYLTLQTSITLADDEYCLTITSARKLFSTDSNNNNTFNIPKNFAYLFTHLQKIFVENEEDLEFFDVCYECLMIVKEYLPNKIEIQVDIMEEIVEEGCVGGDGLSLADFVENFENEKNEEFSRRVNSNFKTLISHHDASMTKFQVQNLLYLAEHFYFYKNKISALKYLAYNQHIPKQAFAQVEDQYLVFLKDLSLDEDFRAYCDQVIEKVAVAREIVKNQQEKQSQSNMKSCENQLQIINMRDIDRNLDKKSSCNNHLQDKKQFRQPNNKKLSIKAKRIDSSPLKLSSKQNRNLNRSQHKPQKDDKLLNLSVKSLLFQLRQSQSLKRLSMLIEAAAQIRIEDEKYEIKIEKQIENLCRKFLKQSYLERYETNKEALQQSREKGNFQRQKQILIDESFIPTQEQVLQVTKFYKSLVSYFSRKDPSLKMSKNNKQMRNKKTQQKSRIQGGVTGKYGQLLEQICQKIEQKYYSQ